ncbi:helix-turn-helix domain-containing protein [Erwinia tasmaniensis]|nr:helix-turn-helix domain-containing protein [Erwinia tasmaniensis]
MQNTKIAAADLRGELMDWLAKDILNGNIPQIARALGISVRTLSRKYDGSGDKDASSIREGDARLIRTIRYNEDGWLSAPVQDGDAFARFFVYDVPPIEVIEGMRMQHGLKQEVMASQIGCTPGAYRNRVMRNTATLTPPEYNLFLLSNGLHPNAQKV